VAVMGSKVWFLPSALLFTTAPEAVMVLIQWEFLGAWSSAGTVVMSTVPFH